jgi:hypothetical protein
MKRFADYAAADHSMRLILIKAGHYNSVHTSIHRQSGVHFEQM